MKAADYRIPWGRPSEHLLAVKREIIGQQLHVRRIQDARNRSTIDTEPPECAHMPHLITRPKKKKIQEDRQREIAAENYSLMHRLAGIMKEERRDPVQKFAHLSVEYRQSLRRKKLLKLETENRRLARSIRKQKPFYPIRAMEKEEDKRQALLQTMSRTERRKERIAMFPVSGRHGNGNHHGGNAASLSSGRHEQHQQQSAAAMNASLVEDGVLFRPGPTAVRLRTAKQMRLEVARRRHGGDSGGDDGEDDQEFFSAQSGGEGGGEGGGGEGGGRTRGLPLSSTRAGSLTVKRRAYSGDSAAAATRGGGGVVLEVNRTGGGGGGGRRRAASVEGRPNMIFTPSLMPVGMESVRTSPMTLGSAGGGRIGSVQWEGRQATALASGGDALGGTGAAENPPRDTRTV